MSSLSVSMCVYDGEKASFFYQALESIYNQTLLPDEIILVIDGPIREELENVIDHFSNSDPALTIFRTDKNMGHGIARKIGLEKCKCEYVAIVDSDDINVSDRFELQVRELDENPYLSIVSSNVYHFSDSISEIDGIEKHPERDAEIKIMMKTRCPICNAAACFRRKDVIAAGGNQDWYMAEDYYLWVRMMKNDCNFYNIQKPLLYVRTNREQISRRGGYKYYRSLEKLFRYMLKNKMINIREYCISTLSRFVLQVILPDKLRASVRKKIL